MTVPANYKFRDKLVQTCAERDTMTSLLINDPKLYDEQFQISIIRPV